MDENSEASNLCRLPCSLFNGGFMWYKVEHNPPDDDNSGSDSNCPCGDSDCDGGGSDGDYD